MVKIYCNPQTRLHSVSSNSIQEAVDSVNQVMLKMKPVLGGISKTTISTLITEKFPYYLCLTNDKIYLNPKEKGYPDILYKHNMSHGLEIKSSCHTQWAAHHNRNNDILALHWQYIDECPQIISVCTIRNLTEADWTEKPETKHNMSTPSCNLKITQCLRNDCVTLLYYQHHNSIWEHIQKHNGQQYYFYSTVMHKANQA